MVGIPTKIVYAPEAYQAQMTTVLQKLIAVGFLNIIAATALRVNPEVFTLLVMQQLVIRCQLTGTYSLPLGTVAVVDLTKYFYFA